jgi:hypothetical protein
LLELQLAALAVEHGESNNNCRNEPSIWVAEWGADLGPTAATIALIAVQFQFLETFTFSHLQRIPLDNCTLADLSYLMHLTAEFKEVI